MPKCIALKVLNPVTNSPPISMMPVTVMPIVSVPVRPVGISAIATLLKRRIGPAHRFAVAVPVPRCVWPEVCKLCADETVVALKSTATVKTSVFMIQPPIRFIGEPEARGCVPHCISDFARRSRFLKVPLENLCGGRSSHSQCVN